MGRYSTKYAIAFVLLLSSLTVPPIQAEVFSEQTLFLLLHTNGQSMTVEQVVRKPTAFHAPAANISDTYRYTLLSQDNQTLYTQSFSDPLDIYVDDFSDPGHPRGGKKRRAEARFHLKAPDLANAVRIRFERHDAASDTWKPVGTSPLKTP